MNSDLDLLRQRSDELDREGDDESDEAVEVNRALFASNLADRKVTNRLGIALQNRGELEDAAEVFSQGLSANPVNAVARGRLGGILKKLELLPARSPEEIVETALSGPGRDACIIFIGASIRQIQMIDSEYLAVIDIPSSNRFRVFGGPISACGISKGFLNVMLDTRFGARDLIARLEAAGAPLVVPLNRAGLVPFTSEVSIPRDQVAAFHDEVMEAHVRNLHEAIAAGKSGHYRGHRPDLQAYLLSEADKLT